MMKIKTNYKLILLSLSFVICCSCSNSNNRKLDNNVAASSATMENNIVAVSTDTLSSVSTSCPIKVTDVVKEDNYEIKKQFINMINSKSNPIEIKLYLIDNATKFSNSEATELFEKLLAYVESEAERYDNIIFSEKYGDLTWKLSELLDDPNQFDKIQDLEYRDIITEIYKYGFEINLYEGYYPKVDINYILFYEDFKQYLTDEYNTYFKLIYFDHTFGAEGILIASIDELSFSIYELDKFISNYPNSKYKEEIEAIFNYNLSYYLEPITDFGATESDGVYVFGTKQIDSYKQVITKYKSTRYAQIIEDYLEILTSKNYRDEPLVEQFRSKYNE